MYAADTSVSVIRTRAEIEDLVQRAGARRIAAAHDEGRASITFEMLDRRVQFDLRLPKLSDFRLKQINVGHGTVRTKERPVEEQQREWERSCRARWRALLLTVKAKLVSVDAGIETFEEAFLAHIIVAHEGRDRRFGDLATRAIAESYTGRPLPPLLGSGK